MTKNIEDVLEMKEGKWHGPSGKLTRKHKHKGNQGIIDYQSESYKYTPYEEQYHDSLCPVKLWYRSWTYLSFAHFMRLSIKQTFPPFNLRQCNDPD